MKNLVIVESPAKARTITKFLGSDYKVLASMGHVRDLPKSKLGFDPENNFEPQYMVSRDKTKVIAELKKNITKDTVIYLAADEDREGEAIAWHLIPALKIQKNTIKRIVFHEITKTAIMKALENPREVDQNLVDAQQARRILDRAVGYKLSPLIWKKVRYGLSAGRVQSVAVRIIVDKEREIEAFDPVEFWKVKADFLDPSLRAELVKINGKTSKVKNEDEAKIIELSCNASSYLLEDIEEKESKRNPAPPFTTSTLQQEASRKAGFGVKQTMIVAQQLYEGSLTIPGHSGGLITYMRTDSVNLSSFATSMAKDVIESEYGKEYSLEKPRHYKSKAKGAQEAHEAIRPVNLALKPSDVRPYMDNGQYRLYSLIWKRTIATQMAQAVVANTTYKIKAGKDSEYEFQSKGTRIVFAGFMKSYTEGSDDPEAALENTEKILPTIKKGSTLDIEELTTEQNFTKPPARYTEASLVKKMEAEGIGRPSTYAPTIATIQAREYIIKTEDKKLKPTLIGTVVNDFLVEHFEDIVSLGFTAKVEEQFDDIAEGKIAWNEVMKNFYSDFVKNVDDKTENAPRAKFSDIRELGEHPELNKPITARVGQYGPYVQCGTKEDEDKPKIASIPNNLSVNNITLEESLVLLQLPKVLGQDESGDDIKVNIGRFGPYLQIKSTYYSLKEDDPYTIELERALVVIAELKEIKAKSLLKDFPDEDTQILIGRYGPYIKSKKKNFKLPKELDEQDIKALSWDEVKTIIKNQPVKGKRGATKKATTKKTVAKKTPAKKTTTTKKTAEKKTPSKKATKKKEEK
ncbi:MAG TPA: type I DNA topoisomerase [Arcobacter sp.]|nr:type I DNA topoisomerase [Arcobacter sp.]HIP55696.1 type I DNA topoisomerase [Arcobacter sp.]